MLGFGFVVLNVLFSIILFFWFKVDMKVSKQILTPESRRIKSILEEYDVLVKLISMFELNVNLVRGTSENTSYSNDHSNFKQIASSLPFYRSRVLGEMATILSAYSEVVDDFLNAERMIMTDTIEEMTGEKYREIFESMDSVCKRMNESVEELAGEEEGGVGVGGVREICKEHKIKYIESVLQGGIDVKQERKTGVLGGEVKMSLIVVGGGEGGGGDDVYDEWGGVKNPMAKV